MQPQSIGTATGSSGFKAGASENPEAPCMSPGLCFWQLVPGKPVAHNYKLRSMDYGLLWGIVAHDFGLLGFPGIWVWDPMTPSCRGTWILWVRSLPEFGAPSKHQTQDYPHPSKEDQISSGEALINPSLLLLWGGVYLDLQNAQNHGPYPKMLGI